jgi:hypothetical protein
MLPLIKTTEEWTGIFHLAAADRSSRTMILDALAVIRAFVRLEPIQPAPPVMMTFLD